MRAYNSTIQRKKKPCKSCGLPSFIFSRGRCESCARIEDTLARDEKEIERLIKEEDLSGLIEDADTIISQYVRLKGADERGLIKCYTCPTVKHWTLMDAGHFLKRSHLYLRWDVTRNLRPQCKECNQIKDGNMPEYRKRLEEDMPGLPDILKEEAALVYKPTREEIRQIISQYTPLVKELKKKLKS